MINITDFIKLPREQRQAHLKLHENCIERGGNSTNHKGVLSQYLNTTIPSGRILLCHACNNSKCSNPRHLYWGTDTDNILIDGSLHGTHKNPWERMVEKYGYETACDINRKNAFGNTRGTGNKGKPKTEEHKQKIAAARKLQTNNKGGRKRLERG